MRTLLIMFLVILLTAPLYAADYHSVFQQGQRDLIPLAIEAQRLKMEQERLQMEKEKMQFDMEQQRLEIERQKGEIDQKEKLDRLTIYLDQEVPDWRQIGNDPGFKKWINETIPSTTYTRVQLLKASIADGNGLECAKFFKDYKASLQSQKSSNDNTASNADSYSYYPCYMKCKRMYEAKQLKKGVDINACMRVICK